MKLKEYAKTIQELAKKYPNLDVIYSVDDEGNAFSKLNMLPSIGYYDGLMDFTPDDNTVEFERKINAVCIN